MALLLLLTMLALAGAGVSFIFALSSRRHGLAKRVAAGAFVWGAVYCGILFAVSLASDERTLAWGEDKAFCGFYLDCHLHVAVVNVRTAKTVGAPHNQRTAEGLYRIVTVRLSSDARRATLRFMEPEARVFDAEGRAYSRALDAERALRAAEGRPEPFPRDIGPAGDAYTAELIFDLPENVAAPRLLVRDGNWPNRLAELFVIGDEDSLWHRRTFFRLAPAPEQA